MKRHLSIVILAFLTLFLYSHKKQVNLEPREDQTKGTRLVMQSDKGSAIEIGRQYLVLIAIDSYEHWPPLNHPVKDAEEIKKILINRYIIDEVIDKYNEKATKKAIIRLFKDLQVQLKESDSLLILFSGHGYFDRGSRSGFWIPVDGGEDEDAQEKWLHYSSIRGYISKMAAKHILLISDSCFSGGLVKGRPIKIDSKYIKRAYSKRCRLALTSGEIETVPDDSEFARELKSALKENTKRYLDSSRLYYAIKQGMKKTFPLLEPIEESGHEKRAAFLLFLKKPGLYPPPNPRIDFNDLIEEAKWVDYQEEFKQSVKKAEDFELKSNIPDNLKKQAWQRVLDTFQADNPFSTEDEKLRDYAGKRVEYWSKKPVPLLFRIDENNQYALIIGINHYEKLNNLNNAVFDAKELKYLLIERYKYRSENIIELYDREATQANIETRLRELVDKLTHVDNLLVYFSGHGHLDKTFDTGFWLPSDCGIDQGRGQQFASEEDMINDSYLKISNGIIQAMMKNCKAHHIFVVADACFSGHMLVGRKFRIGGDITPNPKYLKKKSRQVLASGRERVSDGMPGERSPFAKYFLKFLKENTDQYMIAQKVIGDVMTAVSRNSDQLPLGGPVKNVGDEGGQFFFTLSILPK